MQRRTPKRAKSAAKAAADKIFSEMIRSVGYCENCYRKPPAVQLQCAHIISRRYGNTRTDFRNAFSLCAKCHMAYTDHPVEFAKFIQRTWANQFYDVVLDSAQSMSKVDWVQRKTELRDLQQRLESGGISLLEIRERAL